MNKTIGITIENWIIEATSGHNDGYTRLHYTKQLSEIKDRLNSLEFLKKHKDDPAAIPFILGSISFKHDRN